MDQQRDSNMYVQKIDITTIIVDFLRALKRMWGRVIVLGLLCGVVSYFYADSQYQAYYTASATFTITIKAEQSGTATNFFDNEAAEQMARTFPQILTSSVLRRRVAADMGVPAVSGGIRAEATKDTNLFTLSVTDTDGERAYNTLQSVIENYPELSEVIVGKVNMKLLDTTGVPEYPDNAKNVKMEVVKGVLFGTSLGILWVGFVAVTRKTIRREEDCIKYVNHRCLGTIPFVRLKRRSEDTSMRINILENKASVEFLEAIRIVHNKVERSAKENSLKKILVTSALAGEGKSTIAVNLALSIAQEGKKVALLDCDLRNPSDNEILNVETEKGIVDCLENKQPFNECAYTAKMLGLGAELKFIYVPAGRPVADGAAILDDDRMDKIITYLESKVDYVILDSAPVGLLTDASILAQYADGAVFVVKKDFAKADHILRGMEHLAESNIHIMGCVLNGE